MNPEIKARWVAALRSGEYQQTRGRLRTLAGSGFCCLGVLCDLHSAAAGGTWFLVGYDEPKHCYMNNAGSLPQEVRTWAGLPHAYGDSVEIDGVRAALSEHNDGLGAAKLASFADIADAIEAQL